MSDVQNWQETAVNLSNTAGAIRQVGTSSAPLVVSVPSMAFDKRYYKNLATSGESIARYERLYVAGAGGEGITARLFTSVDNVAAANARGAHISLSFGATGKITGLGTPLETTLHVPSGAGAWAGGTYAGLKVAVNSDAATSDPVGATECSFIRFDNQGNATGAADVDTDFFLFSLQGFTPGATDCVSSQRLAELPANSIGFKIKVGANTYYIPAVIAAEWN